VTPRPYRVLVTGGRNHSDRKKVWDALDAVWDSWGWMIVFEGGATGADRLAKDWADDRGVYCASLPALWNHKPRHIAGPERNAVMVSLEPDEVLAFPDPESRGTWDCVRKAEAAGLLVTVFE